MCWLSVMRLGRWVRSNVDRQLSSSGGDGRHGEAGAVATIVAVLFGFGVLLGLGALVIDTGSLLYERRQLQNGADAVALAVGKECAGNPACAPDKSVSSALTAVAGANASDGLTTIESICGNLLARTANPGLTETCLTISSPQLVDCPPVPSTFVSAPYIEVRTATRTANTSNPSILPPILAQTLVGGGYRGETVRACSRAAWVPGGSPIGAVLPVAFSYCQWQAATGFVPPPIPPATTPAYNAGHFELPPYPVSNPGPLNPGYGSSPNTAWPGTEVPLYTQSPSHPSGSCPTWNTHVAPGTFGELAQTGCNADVTNNWVQGANGNPAPCDLTLLNALRGTITYVPIFDCYTPAIFDFANPPSPAPDCNDNQPANWYHISGYAAFYLTGFNFSGGPSYGPSIFPPDGGAQPCGGSDRCVSGWFTTGALAASPSTTWVPSFGASAVQLAG